jgi:CheY-like chemotaxis protein
METKSQVLLVVEDDPSDVFIIQRALRKSKVSHSLQVVTDGQMAINYLAGHGKFGDRTQYPLPSLIFLDLKIPYKHGFEVLEWVRQQPSLQDCPVVVLSSSSEERDMERAYRLGARSFLVKPPTPGMLLEVLHAFQKPCGASIPDQ